MSMHFTDRLIEAIVKKGTPICVGLDPRLDHIPAFLAKRAIEKSGKSFEAAGEVFLEFNRGIIDAIFDLVPAVKPQLAFYLQYGSAGLRAFEATCRYAKEKGLIVIADAKSNDIGSTAEAYAKAFLGESDVFGKKVSVMDCDALTVNPYLGYDGVKPFVELCRQKGKGIFVLVKTSNPSSGDLQNQITKDGQANFELVAALLESWGADVIGQRGYSSVGAVVGATYPHELKKLRRVMPHTYFLIPGYGAQGGKAADVAAGFNADGLGALVNSSRDIIFAWQKAGDDDAQASGRASGDDDAQASGRASGDEKKFGVAARQAVVKMKEELLSAIGKR